MKKFWEIFSSVKTAIVLFFLIAGTSVVGTVIEQQPTPQMYERIYGPTAAKIIKALELYDMYHSWWFQLLLVLFTINLVICSIERLPRVLNFFKREARIKERGYLNQLPFRCITKVKRIDPKEAASKVEEILSEHGFRPKEKVNSQDGVYLFSEKGLINRLGVYITHFSLLFILIGGLIGSIFGYSGNMTIVEGGKTNNVILRGGMENIALPFYIKCNRFQIEFYKNNPRVPKAYISEVEVIENGKSVKKAKIMVNHPLVYKGIYFYQASYGVFSPASGILTVRVRDTRTGKVKEISLKVGEEKEVPGMGIKLRLVAFYPDFVITEEGPTSRSDELNNPAALMEMIQGNETSRMWVFAFFPNVHQKKSEYEVKFVGYKPVFYTVLQVSRDPGVWLVWLGCILMIGAILVTFFYPHRRVFVWITEKGKDTEIAMGFSTNRNHEAFKKMAEKICQEVKTKLKA